MPGTHESLKRNPSKLGGGCGHQKSARFSRRCAAALRPVAPQERGCCAEGCRRGGGDHRHQGERPSSAAGASASLNFGSLRPAGRCSSPVLSSPDGIETSSAPLLNFARFFCEQSPAQPLPLPGHLSLCFIQSSLPHNLAPARPHALSLNVSISHAPLRTDAARITRPCAPTPRESRGSPLPSRALAHRRRENHAPLRTDAARIARISAALTRPCAPTPRESRALAHRRRENRADLRCPHAPLRTDAARITRPCAPTPRESRGSPLPAPPRPSPATAPLPPPPPPPPPPRPAPPRRPPETRP